MAEIENAIGYVAIPGSSFIAVCKKHANWLIQAHLDQACEVAMVDIDPNCMCVLCVYDASHQTGGE